MTYGRGLSFFLSFEAYIKAATIAAEPTPTATPALTSLARRSSSCSLSVMHRSSVLPSSDRTATPAWEAVRVG